MQGQYPCLECSWEKAFTIQWANPRLGSCAAHKNVFHLFALTPSEDKMGWGCITLWHGKFETGTTGWAKSFSCDLYMNITLFIVTSLCSWPEAWYVRSTRCLIGSEMSSSQGREWSMILCYKTTRQNNQWALSSCIGANFARQTCIAMTLITRRINELFKAKLVYFVIFSNRLI